MERVCYFTMTGRRAEKLPPGGGGSEAEATIARAAESIAPLPEDLTTEACVTRPEAPIEKLTITYPWSPGAWPPAMHSCAR